jgi:hypothetical protein
MEKQLRLALRKAWAGSCLRGKPISKATGKSCDWVSHSEQAPGSFMTLKKTREKLMICRSSFLQKGILLLMIGCSMQKKMGLLITKGIMICFLRKALVETINFKNYAYNFHL